MSSVLSSRRVGLNAAFRVLFLAVKYLTKMERTARVKGWAAGVAFPASFRGAS